MNQPRMNPEMKSNEYHLIESGPKENSSGSTCQFIAKISNIPYILTVCKDSNFLVVSLHPRKCNNGEKGSNTLPYLKLLIINRLENENDVNPYFKGTVNDTSLFNTLIIRYL